MKRQMSFIFAVLIVSMLISCANPATSTTTSPTATNPSLQPGEGIGEMILAKDESGEPDIYNHCSPFVVESDPQVMLGHVMFL